MPQRDEATVEDWHGTLGQPPRVSQMQLEADRQKAAEDPNYKEECDDS